MELDFEKRFGPIWVWSANLHNTFQIPPPFSTSVAYETENPFGIYGTF